MKKIELNRTHSNALADILINNLSEGKKFEFHIGAVMKLVTKEEASVVISLALQKAGLEDVMMAGNIANTIVDGKAIPMTKSF